MKTLTPTTSIGPFQNGMDNKAADAALDPHAVRDAVNVDITKEGTISRRKGFTMFVAAERCHSLFSNGARAFFADGTTLMELGKNGSETTIETGLSGNAVAYCEVPGRGIAFTDGMVIKRIVGQTVVPFGIEQPAAPTVSCDATGALLAGLYQIAVAFDTDNGESGTSGATQVDVPENGRLYVTLPQPSDPSVESILVFVSPQNGVMEYLTATVAVGATAIEIPVLGMTGRRAQQHFRAPLPPGDILASYQGRIFVHVGNGMIAYTDPYSTQYDPSRNFVQMPDDVTIIAAVSDGVFIVSDATYFASGANPNEWVLRKVAPETATFGTMQHIANTTNITWMSSSGMAIAGSGGDVKFPAEKRVSFDTARVGASLYREENGMQQTIAAVRGAKGSVAGASMWFQVKQRAEETRLDL